MRKCFRIASRTNFSRLRVPVEEDETPSLEGEKEGCVIQNWKVVKEMGT